MTISKKLKSRSESHATLEYVYRGEKSHPVLGKTGNLLINNARHIGGQLSSSDPFQYGSDCKPNHVNIDELASELDQQITKYRGLGSGKKLIQHYVVSLAPGETLSDKEWRKVVKMFMDEMGYANDTLYTSCVHTEKDHEHAHIVACRVRHNGKLVSDKNDYEKAVAASRKIEKQFGLKITPNPDQTMGVEPTRKSVELDRKGIKSLGDDPAVIIRKRINTVFDAKDSMTQMTMSEFADKLKEQGIQIKVKLNKENQPIGINYSLDSKLWISGSKIKKTRTTWTALLAKEKIDYNPSRDNVALGIGRKEGIIHADIDEMSALILTPKVISGNNAEISFFVKLSQKQKATLKKYNVIEIYKHKTNSQDYALLRFNIVKPVDCNPDSLMALAKVFIALLRFILSLIFCDGLIDGKNNYDFVVLNNPEIQYSFDMSINSGFNDIAKILKYELDFIDVDLIVKNLKPRTIKHKSRCRKNDVDLPVIEC